jgi:hypothetical protein
LRGGCFSIWRLIAYFREELFVAFGTLSSESAMPQVAAKLDALGSRRDRWPRDSRGRLPLNLTAAIYQAMAAVSSPGDEHAAAP